MNELLKKIRLKDASAFTHSGKFHADDVFSSAFVIIFNQEIHNPSCNKVPETLTASYSTLGAADMTITRKTAASVKMASHYAAFGLLWEELGTEILGEELAAKFDEAFVQPLDNNDNTGEKNELASLIGSFNPSWDEDGGTDEAFFRAVSVAGMILDNKFARYLGNERADKRSKKFSKHKILKLIPVFWSFLNSFHARNVFPKQISLSLFFHPTAVVTVSSLRKKNIP